MYYCSALRRATILKARNQSMRGKILLASIVLSIVTAITSSTLSAQSSTDTISIQQDSIENRYERIMLDGQVAYKDLSSNEIISAAAYNAVCGSDTTKHYEGVEYEDWDCGKVNPYKGEKIETPFKISFDQTSFTHPVDGDLVVTSRFGRRRRGPHGGIDLDLVTGDNVRSVLPGKVRYVGYSRGHGKTIVVRHANDIETVYAHLSAYHVKSNDIVTEGQVIGQGGNTGNSRGSHLHLEVRYKGVRIHPEYVFNFDGSQAIRASELWVTNGWRSPRMHSSYRQSKLHPLLNRDDALVAQKNEPRYHRVRRGDTLSHIARRHGLRLRDIYGMNKVTKNSILKIGQVIRVR